MYRNGFIGFSDTPLSEVPWLSASHEGIAGFLADLRTAQLSSGFLGTAHESNSTDDISLKLFNETKTYLEKYVNVTEFSPTTIILGTWYKCNEEYEPHKVWLPIIVLYYVQHYINKIVDNASPEDAK